MGSTDRTSGGGAAVRGRAIRCLAGAIESLEIRRLLSVASNLPPTAIEMPLHPKPVATPYSDSAIQPQYYRAAYGLGSINFGGTPGTGLGETIAIVDGYDDPDLIATGAAGFSTSDLAEFDSLYGFPDPPSFIKVNQNGGSTLPKGTGILAEDASVETSLDVEYAHAMAPSATIVLVECTTLSSTNLAYGINDARQIPGAVAVSMSFGIKEYPAETSTSVTAGGNFNDGYFQVPNGHTGEVFIAASGDSGYGVIWPSASPYVVSAGGTDLGETSGVWNSETGWSGSGGGPSVYEGRPAYQSGVVSSAGTLSRLNPDMSMNAGTQVDIYDNDGLGGSATVTGTSIVAPVLAGVVAVIDQGRSLEGLPSLYTYTPSATSDPQFLPRLYALPSADFHDITTGSSGSSSLAQAGVGYDLVTGIGTPVGGQFIPDLVGGVKISGSIYSDNNANGSKDGGEPGISGVTVYVDVGNTGSYVAGDPMGVSDANGAYSFEADVAGSQNIVIRELPPSGFVQTGTISQTFATSYGASTTQNFGNFPTTYGSAQQYYVRLDGTGTTVQVYQGTSSAGTLLSSIAKATLGSTPLSFQTAAGSTDELVVDYSNGDPMSAAGFGFAPAAGSTSTLLVEGTGASATINVTSAGVVVNGQTISTTGVQNATIDAPGSGSALTMNFTNSPFTSVALNGLANGDTITLTGTNTVGTRATYAFSGSNESLNVSVANPYTITGDAAMGATGGVALTDSGPLTLAGSQTVSGVAINGSNGSVTIARSSPSVQSVVVATSLTVDAADGAYLDLDNNAMVINYSSSSPIGTIDGYLQTGYAGGAWNGAGIRSKAAANDPFQFTAIGALDDQQLSAAQGSNYTSFAGAPVSQNSVLMKYTYYGDANLDGSVGPADVALLDDGFSGFESGWMGGDFDYSGKTDAYDVDLLEIGYGQTPAL